MELTWRGWCRRWRCAPGCSGSLQWRSWCGRQFQSFQTCMIDSQRELKSYNEMLNLNLSLCLRTHLSWAAGSTGVRGTDRGALRSSWGQNLALGVFIRVTACLVRIWFSSLLNSCFRLGNSGGMVSTMDGYLKQTRAIHIFSSHNILNSVGWKVRIMFK